MQATEKKKIADLNIIRLERERTAVQKEYLELATSGNPDPERLAELHERQWEAEHAYARALRQVDC